MMKTLQISNEFFNTDRFFEMNFNDGVYEITITNDKVYYRKAETETIKLTQNQILDAKLFIEKILGKTREEVGTLSRKEFDKDNRKCLIIESNELDGKVKSILITITNVDGSCETHISFNLNELIKINSFIKSHPLVLKYKGRRQLTSLFEVVKINNDTINLTCKTAGCEGNAEIDLDVWEKIKEYIFTTHICQVNSVPTMNLASQLFKMTITPNQLHGLARNFLIRINEGSIEKSGIFVLTIKDIDDIDFYLNHC